MKDANDWVAQPHPEDVKRIEERHFVRLTDEEIGDIEASIPPKMGLNVAKKLFADRIQDALEEKNK